jgi:hypothetical protein
MVIIVFTWVGVVFVALFKTIKKSRDTELEQNKIIEEEIRKLMGRKIPNTNDQIQLINTIKCRRPSKLAEVLALNSNGQFLVEEARIEAERLVRDEPKRQFVKLVKTTQNYHQ